MYPSPNRTEIDFKFVPTIKSPSSRSRFAIKPIDPSILQLNPFVRSIAEIIIPAAIKVLRPAILVIRNIIIPRNSNEIVVRNQTLF
jgi:hypothetical protein